MESLNKRIVIAGATGSVGEGLTAEFLRQGHNVIAVVRNEEKKEKLMTDLASQAINVDRLSFVIGTYSNESEIQDIQSQLAGAGSIDIAIASLGGWYHGGHLYDLPVEDMTNVLESGLQSHLYFSKVILPLLKAQQKGAYILINGGASEFAVPHSGIISVVAAAQKMMAQVLHNELRPYGVTVYGVAAFDLVKTRDRANNEKLWLSPQVIANYITALVQSGKTQAFWYKIQTAKDLQLPEN